MTIRCPECNSIKLEYLPNVDNQSWIQVTYKQVNGKWKIAPVGEKSRSSKEKSSGNVDVSEIETRDIHYNDGMPFYYCEDCTSEIDGRYV
tara:strand:- start:2074 stop:2343 length:270 start_codon:yes stop_codon:yes gene_type:complete